MIFHSEPKFSLNPWESQFLKCKVEEVFVGFVPCSTSHPFFPMTLMPLWFLVFKGHDLLHTQVYMYVYMYTRAHKEPSSGVRRVRRGAAGRDLSSWPPASSPALSGSPDKGRSCAPALPSRQVSGGRGGKQGGRGWVYGVVPPDSPG